MIINKDVKNSLEYLQTVCESINGMEIMITGGSFQVSWKTIFVSVDTIEGLEEVVTAFEALAFNRAKID